MKKAIIFSLLFSILAGSAVAQLTFSGEVYAGVELTNPNRPSLDESITTTHRDYGSPRFDLSATVTRDNYGARLVTRFQNMPGGGQFIVRGIYGWVDFNGLASANDTLRLSMGNFADGIWVMQLDSDLPELTGDNMRVPGFRFTYSTPIQGLTVGAAFRADSYDFQQVAQRMIFGGTWVTPHFSALFAYDLGWNVSTLFGVNVPAFGFVGLHDLSAGFKLYAENLSTWDTRVQGFGGQLQMHQRVGYRISWPLSVSLIASQRLFGNPDINDIEVMFGPGVAYRINPNLTASFRAMIESPDHFTTMDMALRPALELMLTGPALLYMQYELRLPDFGSSNPMDRAVHVIGFGLEIRAF
ncbi:MAG: hypothetical protein FWC64_06280 [Treponema sp.]|nr:hypothetical protein [Treponema sp.]